MSDRSNFAGSERQNRKKFFTALVIKAVKSKVITLKMKISFILVEPKVPENIGASARAIKTMGFDSFILVNPCEYREGKSRRVAHASEDILDNALVFNSLSQALEGFGLAVATSIRPRRVREDVVNAKDLPDFMLAKSASVVNAAIVFGREESGLNNDEIKLCDIVSAIPMRNAGYPSLNLSHAVMVYAYLLSGLSGKTEKSVKISSAENNSFLAMKKKAGRILLKLGLEETDMRYGRIMERLSFLLDVDINLVHTLCDLIDEKL